MFLLSWNLKHLVKRVLGDEFAITVSNKDFIKKNSLLEYKPICLEI